MGYDAPLNGGWRWLRGWLWNLGDALPPYNLVEGTLEAKEAGPGGKFYVRVGPAARVEVDWLTFRMLTVGDRLRMRYTRGNRAVNIDRLLPRSNL